jgi:hypothetical protein
MCHADNRIKCFLNSPPLSERNFNGAGNQNRTGDLILTMDALCLLSYAGL